MPNPWKGNMPAASKLSVVIVDDQMTIRSLVRTGLNQIAINEVREFGVAEDALKHIKGHAPNVVISDFDMPGMNGLELLKGIRADMKLKNTAFILLTARADKDLVQRVLNDGYARDLNDVEVEEIGLDPFLIAAALAGLDRVVVTREVSKPTATRAKRRIPDVCATFGITSITDYRLYSILKFSIP